eukprot:363009-Chlamydomonas_euryale.AAC.3
MRKYPALAPPLAATRLRKTRRAGRASAAPHALLASTRVAISTFQPHHVRFWERRGACGDRGGGVPALPMRPPCHQRDARKSLPFRPFDCASPVASRPTHLTKEAAAASAARTAPPTTPSRRPPQPRRRVDAATVPRRAQLRRGARGCGAPAQS